MKHSFAKILSSIMLSAVMLTAVSCQKEPTKVETVRATVPAPPATADKTARISTPDEPSAAATATIAEPTAPPPTIADPDDVLTGGTSDPNNIYDAGGFVSVSDLIPDVQLEIRYSTSHNFVGVPVNGYDEPLALLTKEAAAALIKASNDLREEGYLIKIYDAYRPQRAVNHFVSWANDWEDTATKSEFYPDLDKSVLFSSGYIAYNSGHSRGSTIDLTLVDAATGEEIDMGGPFDYFGTLSHPDYTGISSEQYQNRMKLREAMINNGFSPLSTEWWHFSLNGEPYPYTYFDFPVSAASLSGS